MASSTVDDSSADRGYLSSDRAGEICRAFALGDLERVEFLPSGLMNQNWRFWTDSGSFAIKRVTDVGTNLARRNLRPVVVRWARR